MADDDKKRTEIRRKNASNQQNVKFQKAQGKQTLVFREHPVLKRTTCHGQCEYPLLYFQKFFVAKVDIKKEVIELEDGTEIPFDDIVTMYPCA
jgi:hypothetical protein